MHELQKLRILVGHALDAQLGFLRLFHEAAEDGLVYLAAPGGNRVAVRVDGGVVEQRVDAGKDHVGYGVLQVVGLAVDLRPVQAQHLHQEQLHQPVAAQHVERERLARPGQTAAVAR